MHEQNFIFQKNHLNCYKIKKWMLQKVYLNA